MAILRVGGRGQVTIPGGIREAIGIKEGRKLVCYVDESGDIVLHVLPAPHAVDDVMGLIKGKTQGSIEEALERAAEDHGRQWTTRKGSPGATAIARAAREVAAASTGRR